MSVYIKKKIVKKFFLSRDKILFYNELYWLKKFKKYEFVPKILDIDYKNYAISLSHVGERISKNNKPKDWVNQLSKILNYLKKKNCFHSDIKPDNLLVKNKKLFLIDFAQSIKISDLKKDTFLKKRIFFDQYSINRVGLSIENNSLLSNDLRILVIWNSKNQKLIERKIEHNKNLLIIDKIKLRKNFYTDICKDRIYWIDQFYNKKISKNTNKLKNNIFVYVIKSINPIFKLNKMIFTNKNRVVDHKIFIFKRKIRKNKLNLIHISDNFEESKRNAIFFSKTKRDYPAQYFFRTQNIFDSKKDFFKHLNKFNKLKYVILRNQNSDKEDIDILVNDYFLFKRISDCHSYKKKNLDFLSNSGDPVDDSGFKVSNYIKIKEKIVKLDVRYLGDGYFDTSWQNKILSERKFFKGYYIPNKENFIYSILYHVVYHKGFIDEKYINFIKKNFKLKIINFMKIVYIINEYLKLKKYKVTRPLDLTIPVTYRLNNLLIINEFQSIKKQIESRNFSGANRMIYNLFRFQKSKVYFNTDIFLLLIINQYNLFKAKLKNFIFKYFKKND